MKTVMITGASGLIGRELTGMLLQKGYNVIATDKTVSPFVGQPNFSFMQCDIVDKGKLASLIEGSKIDSLIHLACSVDNDIPSVITDKEIDDSRGTDKYIFKTAVGANIKDILLLSTTQIYATQKTREPIRETADEKPMSYYAEMKADSEKALVNNMKKGNTKVVIMRAAPIYTRKFPDNLHSKIYDFKDGVAYLYKEGEYGFSFCCLYNLIDFVIGILGHDGSYQYQGVYNIADTRPITARQIVEFEREFHHLGAVIQRNYSTDAVKATISGAGKRPKTDYRYVDMGTVTSNIYIDNTKAQRISTFRWNLTNTK